MEDSFNVLECTDDDVLSFSQTKLFKFGQFKEQLKQKILEKIGFLFRQEKHYHREDYLINHFRRIDFEGLGFGEFDIKMTWSSPREGIDCEILRLGSKNWQKGKLRSHANIELFPKEKEFEKRAVIQLTLEFCPDEPDVEEKPASNEITQPESPLDDLRQMINQENQQ